MKPTPLTQLRIRLSPEACHKYGELPPLARMRAVSLILNAQAKGIDLEHLLLCRRALVNLGNFLNQSLRSSWGQSVDGQAAAGVVKVLKELLG